MRGRLAERVGPTRNVMTRDIGHDIGCNVSLVPDSSIPEDPAEGPSLWEARAAQAGFSGVQAYASTTSVEPDATIDFRVNAVDADQFTVAVYRLGYYGGVGARLMMRGPTLAASTQPAPSRDEDTGLVSCAWHVSWTLTVPATWPSGVYVAEFATVQGRGYTPFVVRDDRRPAPLCVVVPFMTYQAENPWAGSSGFGRSLSYGYIDGDPSSYHRAAKVTFDRPYEGDGLPEQLVTDRHALAWLDEQDHDMVYVTDLDLHLGRADLSRFTGLVFAGTSAYWSVEMRRNLAQALASGVSAAFLSAGNGYWHTRVEASATGEPGRVIVCYKDRPDPDNRAGMATLKWRIRHPGPGAAEQMLLGAQRRGTTDAPAPLVVGAADHWFWAGTGVRDGDEIGGLVDGTIDDFDPHYPSPPGMWRTSVAASPCQADGNDHVQRTTVCEAGTGRFVFTAGTSRWGAALGDPSVRDDRIRTATANVLDRMLAVPALSDLSRRLTVAEENQRPGSRLWRIEDEDTLATDEAHLQIEGYASQASVIPGDRLHFHVRADQRFTIAIHRIGHYRGLGSRRLVQSAPLPAVSQPDLLFDDRTRRAECDWSSSWHLDIPDGFTSGVYVATFTTEAGYRSLAPFVVADPHSSAQICVVLPMLTYQATNRWPLDGVHGTSLVFGYYEGASTGATGRTRAFEVSFDRPYTAPGLPAQLQSDLRVISWLESQGYDVTYAADLDLHSGRVDPRRFHGLLFLGQHEYWTSAIRDRVEQAVRADVSLAFLGPGTSHWHARLEAGRGGRPDRTLACYKTDPDPRAEPGRATTRWRARPPGPARHEQALTGVGLIGRTAEPADLVCRNTAHWVWSGTGVTDGTTIAQLVAGHVDGIDPAAPTPASARTTVLAESPFILLGKQTERTHHACIAEFRTGAFVFSCGTQAWSTKLAGDEPDARVQAATANVLRRMAEGAKPGRSVSTWAKRLLGWRDRLRA